MFAGQITRQQTRAKNRAKAKRMNGAMALNARGLRLQALGPKKSDPKKELRKLEPDAQALFNKFTNQQRQIWHACGCPLTVKGIAAIFAPDFAFATSL